MANVLSKEKKEQVLALGRLGWSLRAIERSTAVRRETAAAYLKAARIPIRRRGGRPAEWPPKPAITMEVCTDSEAAKPATTMEVSTDSDAAKPATTTEVSTDLVWPRPGRAPAASACEPHRELIELAMRQGRNAMAIWQDLVEDHGFRGKYASVRRFVAKLRASPEAEAHVVIETRPGEEGQVDWGEGPMVRDPSSGKYRRTRLFVFVLAHSRKAVRLLAWKSSSEVWAQLHERAFRRLGGAPRVVVLDNLREGVLKPDVYDPVINPLYRDVLAHYGVVALPCRVRDPDRKGKVESGVGHAQKTPLRGLRFETLEQAQAYLDRWEAHWADTRIHGTTKRQVVLMYAEEKPCLLPLPLVPFRYYRHGERIVHIDGYVEVDGAYYGAPPGWIGKMVQVQWDGTHVRLLEKGTGRLLREHLRQERGGHRMAPEDMPSRAPQSTLALLVRARNAGTHIGQLCAQIHAARGEPGVRHVLGVLALAKKHGVATVEEAAALALDVGAAEYRFLRRYLERRPALPLTLRQVDPLIRQLSVYRDLIEQRTGGP